MSITDTLSVNVATTQEGFNSRVLATLKAQRKTKTWLAKEIGVSKQAMNYLLHHSSVPKYINEIAKALAVTPEWLLFGRGARFSRTSDVNKIMEVPIFDMQNICTFIKDRDINIARSFTPMLLPPFGDVFAVILDSTSMEPLFTHGTVLFFNASYTAHNADYVLFSKDNTAFFRQFFIDGKDVYLKAADPMFQPFTGNDITIYGVLIESRLLFKHPY